MKKVMVGFVALGAAALQAYPASATTAEAPPAGSGSPPAVASVAGVPPADAASLRAEMQAEAASRASAGAVACNTVPIPSQCIEDTPSTVGATTAAPSLAHPAGPRTALTATGTLSAFNVGDPFGSLNDTWAPLCTGTGSDGFRVQAILAYDPAGSGPTQAKLDQVRAAIANADLSFSQSALKTGGQRRVRFATTGGSPGCQPSIVTAPVTSGLASFDALRSDLVLNGYAQFSDTVNNDTKYLIWTEGNLDPNRDNACGVGLTYNDDWPGAFDNANVWTSFAAVKNQAGINCWDIAPAVDGGGSVPAHELMHVLGAVQDSAPHAFNGGHCNDEYDLMCYGTGMVPFPECSDLSANSLFDCNNDDYFNTNPAPGSYLCSRWNAARSPYLHGWLNGLSPIGPVSSLNATGVQGGIDITWQPPAGCPGPSFYGLRVSGSATQIVDGLATSVFVPTAPGTYDVDMGAWRDSGGPLSRVTVSVPAPVVPEAPPNHPPTGGIVISATQGHSYGLLAYAFDPDGDVPSRVRVTVEGVSSKEYDWNYPWDDMPRFTGLNHHESFVFLAQLPSGDRNVCFDAQDAQTGEWTNIGCRRVSVK